MNNVLITGHSQNLGKALSEEFAPTHNVIGVSSNEIDFLHHNKTPQKYINMNYDFVIINARRRHAAWDELLNINCTNQIRFVLDIKNNINKGLIFISSRLSRISEISNGKCDGRIDRLDYAISKAGLNIASIYLARHCEYPVFSIDPGSFATPVRPNKTLMPEDVARGIKDIIDNDIEKYDGKLVKYTGEVLLW
jgi:hypothetical protein